MQVQFFTIPALAYEDGQEALNKFLRGRRVLEVRQEFMASGDGAYWCIAVKYIERNKKESKLIFET